MTDNTESNTTDNERWDGDDEEVIEIEAEIGDITEEESEGDEDDDVTHFVQIEDGEITIDQEKLRERVREEHSNDIEEIVRDEPEVTYDEEYNDEEGE